MIPVGTAISMRIAGLVAVFAMKESKHGVPELALPAQPQSVVQTFHRFRLADIDVVVLRGGDSLFGSRRLS